MCQDVSTYLRKIGFLSGSCFIDLVIVCGEDQILEDYFEEMLECCVWHINKERRVDHKLTVTLSR